MWFLWWINEAMGYATLNVIWLSVFRLIVFAWHFFMPCDIYQCHHRDPLPQQKPQPHRKLHSHQEPLPYHEQQPYFMKSHYHINNINFIESRNAIQSHIKLVSSYAFGKCMLGRHWILIIYWWSILNISKPLEMLLGKNVAWLSHDVSNLYLHCFVVKLIYIYIYIYIVFLLCANVYKNYAISC